MCINNAAIDDDVGNPSPSIRINKSSCPETLLKLGTTLEYSSSTCSELNNLSPRPHKNNHNTNNTNNIVLEELLIPTPLTFTSAEKNKINEITAQIIKMFPSDSRPEVEIHSSIHGLVEDSFRAASLDYGTREATAWGMNFVWPDDIVNRDLGRLALSGNSLSQAVMELRLINGSTRLNADRVKRVVPRNDPDFDRLCTIATNGMPVLVNDGFVPNNTPLDLRPKFQLVQCAIHKMLYDLWLLDLIFIIPTSVALTLPETVHFSAPHWAPNRGKESGRYIFDASDDAFGALNTPIVKDMVKELCGPIEHPTIFTLINLILDAEDSCISSGFLTSELILWKADLARAFTQLDFAAQDVHLVACSLSDNKTVIYHTGNFGWTGLPYNFQVVTRVVKRLLRAKLPGGIEMYVDDIIGVCMQDQIEKTIIPIVHSTCEDLMGPTAIAPKKWVIGRRVELIGWDVDLDLRAVTISRKNFQKAFYGFFMVDLTAKGVSVKELERLASWSSRYSTILRLMEPFSTIFYAAIVGMKNPHVHKDFTIELKQAVQLWRVMFVMLRCNERTFARSFDSFRINQPASILLVFDACLTGVGIVVYRLIPGNLSPELIGGDGVVFPFNLNGDSSYQNSCEFLAVLVGLYYLARARYHHITISLRGDSKTALRWALTERFKGPRVLRAAMAYVLLGTRNHFWVNSSEWIAGLENVIADDLSRGVSSSATRTFEDGSMSLHLRDDPCLQQLLMLSNPSSEFGGKDVEDDYTALWLQYIVLFKQLE